VRLHDLGHFAATRLLTAGIDLRTVAGRLRHPKASTTLNVYASFVPDADRRAGSGDLAAARPHGPPQRARPGITA
jgi:integrase